MRREKEEFYEMFEEFHPYNSDQVNTIAWVRDITGALTVQVIVEYLQVWNLVENHTINNLAEDRFIWKWTADHCFTTASAYRAFFIGQHPIPRAKLLRKTKAPDGCKFFVWLVLHDRCWTAARQKRHNLLDDDVHVSAL